VQFQLQEPKRLVAEKRVLPGMADWGAKPRLVGERSDRGLEGPKEVLHNSHRSDYWSGSRRRSQYKKTGLELRCEVRNRSQVRAVGRQQASHLVLHRFESHVEESVQPPYWVQGGYHNPGRNADCSRSLPHTAHTYSRGKGNPASVSESSTLLKIRTDPQVYPNCLAAVGGSYISGLPGVA
jgi:hypothetical protein